MSNHCSSFEPGIVATTSNLAVLILSVPFLSLYFLNPYGATLSRSTVAPIFLSCLARQSRTLSCIRVLHGLFWHDRMWSPISSLIAPHSHTLASPVRSRSGLLAAVFHSSSGIPCSGEVSVHDAPTPVPQLARKAALLFVSIFIQSPCAVMISCTLKVRLMEKEKPFPFAAFTRSHLNGPVIVSLLSSCPTFSEPSHTSPSLSCVCSSASLSDFSLFFQTVAPFFSW